MFVDLSLWLPWWSATALRVFEGAGFAWLMIGRRGVRRAWGIHPSHAETPIALANDLGRV